jgi:hypothetical protein
MKNKLLSRAGNMLHDEAGDVLHFLGIDTVPQPMIGLEVYGSPSCLQSLQAFLPICIPHLHRLILVQRATRNERS